MEKQIVLEARHISKYFSIRDALGKQTGQVKAVNDVSLTLYEGETYGLVGETGCGKSTLGRTILRLTEPTSGSIMVRGKDFLSIREKELREMRRQVQMVFQDPYTSLNPKKRVGNILTEALDIHNIGSKKERTEIALSILDKVGLLPEHFFRYPHEFSGGQRQRIGLARALILDPSVIVCDEPVSALDVSVQSQIINLLLDLQDSQNVSYLFIAHDISVVEYISSRVGVMYLGHIMEEAPTRELFTNPQHPYTQALLSAVPLPDPHQKKERVILEGEIPSPIHAPAGCVFHTRCKHCMEICRQHQSEMTEIAPDHRVACHLCTGKGGAE